MIAAESLNNWEAKLSDIRVLVIGDLMLDHYMNGNTSRISPEAPVPVVEVYQEEHRLGGAANVALNLSSLGAQVSVCGVTGADPKGQLLNELLNEKGFDTFCVLSDPNRKTTIKTRIISQGQHMLRVDREDRFQIEGKVMTSLLTSIEYQLDNFDAILFEDYDKGLLSKPMISAVIEMANKKGIITTVDPKFRNFGAYEGCTLFKPNLKELNEATGRQLLRSEIDKIEQAVLDLRGTMPHSSTLITLSEHGVLTVNEDKDCNHFPAHPRKILDVSGAGDTVISIATLGLAGGLSLESAALLANLGGGLVCEESGVVPIQKSQLLDQARGLID